MENDLEKEEHEECSKRQIIFTSFNKMNFAAQVAAVPFDTWFTINKEYKMTLADGSTVQGVCAGRYMYQKIDGIGIAFYFPDGTRNGAQQEFFISNTDANGLFVIIPRVFIGFRNPPVDIPIASLPISIDQTRATAALSGLRHIPPELREIIGRSAGISTRRLGPFDGGRRSRKTRARRRRK